MCEIYLYDAKHHKNIHKTLSYTDIFYNIYIYIYKLFYQ